MSADEKPDEITALRKELALAEMKLGVKVEGELPETTPPKWEYFFLTRLYSHKSERIGTIVNELGRDGWEMMSVDFEHGKAAFKRQL